MRRFSHDVIALVSMSVVILGGCFDKSTATGQAAGAQIKLQRMFSNLEFFQPVALIPVPNDNNQLWVVEKQGRVFRIVEREGNYAKEIVVDISDRVNSSPNEAGLLGLAFHPRFEQNRQVFLSYNAKGSRLPSTISRFGYTADGRIDPGSEQVLLQVDQPYGNHNGGQVAFGPDGYLYIGLGDGGAAGDPQENGQNTNTLLGAMLRIDVDNGTPYAIPKDNPFASSDKGRGEIYAWGLRNPWRWSFDRATGELWVADVGQNDWEEINLMNRSGNYGWNLKEGTHCYNTSDCDATARAANVIEPVAEYSHDQGCSVTGGYVYRGEQIKSLQGTYLFGDFCSGRIWGLTRHDAAEKNSPGFQKTLLVKSDLMISSFAQDNLGEIYVLHYDGEIYKIVPVGQ